MFEEQSNSGQTVEWNPEHTDLAAEALANVSGTGVSSKADAKAAAAVQLGTDHTTASDVLEEYEALKEANNV